MTNRIKISIGYQKPRSVAKQIRGSFRFRWGFALNYLLCSYSLKFFNSRKFIGGVELLKRPNYAHVGDTMRCTKPEIIGSVEWDNWTPLDTLASSLGLPQLGLLPQRSVSH